MAARLAPPGPADQPGIVGHTAGTMPPSTTVRLARGTDAAAVAAIYAPMVDGTAVSFETTPPDADEMRDRITRTLPTWPWLVADHGDAIVGFAYGGRHRDRAAYRWSTDVSVYLAADARGRGIGRQLYTTLLALLTAQGYANAYAGITLPNAASVGLHQVLGFEPIGVYRTVGWKLGAWRDVAWWQRRLRTLEVSPAEPVPLDALADDTIRRCLRAPER